MVLLNKKTISLIYAIKKGAQRLNILFYKKVSKNFKCAERTVSYTKTPTRAPNNNDD